MKYTLIHGYKVPQLILGTAQIGMPYGIINCERKPDKQKSFEILNYAFESGINFVDTAREYGDAEHVIGEFSQVSKKNFNEITKFKIRNSTISDQNLAKVEAFSSIRCSISNLKKALIPICLYHKQMEQPMEKLIDHIVPILSDLKKDGLIDIAGISVYHPEEVEYLYDIPVIDVIQVPCNIFDHRLMQNERLRKLNEAGKLILARSIFLKGLLFTLPNHLTGFLSGAAKYIKTLHDLANQSKLSVAQLAFSYIRDMEGISGIIFGVDSLDQLKQNINLYHGPGLPARIRKQIETSFADIPEEIITPGVWPI